MSYFKDLSPYRYRDGVDRAVNVGWLSLKNPFFPRGKTCSNAVEELKNLALSPSWRTRGYFMCPFCISERSEPALVNFKATEIVLGSAELIVTSPDGSKFIAPDLVIHYIERHSYRPPQVFLEALKSN
ncbi:DUF7919 family protein [Streptomyces hirsutus]|uniref:DUF7919 family protein n=1 Tax=Streptomyces hirsutus TaxID=35620 RepID=UPI003317C665